MSETAECECVCVCIKRFSCRSYCGITVFDYYDFLHGPTIMLVFIPNRNHHSNPFNMSKYHSCVNEYDR